MRGSASASKIVRTIDISFILKRFDVHLQTWVSAKGYESKNDQNLMSGTECLEILNKTEFNPNSVMVASSKLFGDL